MKNNVYESAVLINAALDDEQIDGIITRIKETIVNNGGEIREVENWGRKRLAYMVKKSKIGYYVIFRFDAPSSIVSKLERFYTLDEYILRFLTVLLDNDALQQIEKNKKALNQDAEVTAVPVPVETEDIKSKEESEVDNIK
ncbi:MAG: 30S ribosomal protein S6 [Ignavibacteriales bacterium]|nr:MAG: 30S ribosomal protein S6 [Ignavibacteriales bacterium]